jgi:hypothetical protein
MSAVLIPANWQFGWVFSMSYAVYVELSTLSTVPALTIQTEILSLNLYIEFSIQKKGSRLESIHSTINFPY